jgi:hypothetical protein
LEFGSTVTVYLEGTERRLPPMDSRVIYADPTSGQGYRQIVPGKFVREAPVDSWRKREGGLSPSGHVRGGGEVSFFLATGEEIERHAIEASK